MSAAFRAWPDRWFIRLGLTLAIGTLACNPPQAVDRSIAGGAIDIGGVMRPAGSSPATAPGTTAGTSPGTTTPGDPPKTSTSIDPPSAEPGATISDAGATTIPPVTDPAAPESDGGASGQPSTPAPALPAADGGAPAIDAGVPGAYVPDPTLSTTVATDCKNSPAWVAESGPFLGGEKITHGTPKRKFECRPWPYAPWCALASYEPGLAGSYWIDAWIDRGLCP